MSDVKVPKTVVAGRGMPGKETANYTLYSDDTILLRGVRARHIHVGRPFQGKAGDDGKVPQPKFNMKAMLEKVEFANAKKLLDREMSKLLVANSVADLPAANKCVKDGDLEGKPEQKGHYIINISENVERPPALRGAKGERYTRSGMTEAAIDAIFYAGAKYNVLLKFWYQPGYGKKANANLLAVQFAEAGEKFADGGITDSDVDDAFGIAGDVGGFEDDSNDL